MDGEESSIIAAIKNLIEQHGLSEELVADTTSREGFFIWKRTLGNKKHGLRLLPSHCQLYGYLFAWYERDGDKLYEGKPSCDFEHALKVFSRFLIDGEDRKQISNDHPVYKLGWRFLNWGPGVYRPLEGLRAHSFA